MRKVSKGDTKGILYKFMIVSLNDVFQLTKKLETILHYILRRFMGYLKDITKEIFFGMQ